VSEYHFEYWLPGDPECHRISVQARCYEHAKQIVIGRYAPNMLRRLPQ
jgi:hypothetical protein